MNMVKNALQLPLACPCSTDESSRRNLKRSWMVRNAPHR